MHRSMTRILLLYFMILLSAAISAASTNTADLERAKAQATRSDTVKVMLACLKSADPFVRLGAVKALGDLRDAVAIDPLIAGLQDENLYVRAYAAEALGKLRCSLALPPLMAAMDDQDFFVRAHAVMALGELGNRRAVSPLFTRLLDGEEELKPYAVWALLELKDAGVVKSLFVRSLIASLSNGQAYEPVGHAFRKRNRHDPGRDFGERQFHVAGSFAGAIAVQSVRITVQDRHGRTHGTVRVVSDLKAPLTVDDVLTMTFDGIELFSEPLSRFRLAAAEIEADNPSPPLVPAQYVHQENHLLIRLCVVTGYLEVRAAMVDLSELDPSDGVDVVVRRNEDAAVDNIDVAAGRGGTLVFPIAP